jgi:glutamate formiminotransferase
MLDRIVECVPNFSEGRDISKVGAIVAEIESTKDVYLLDRSSDEGHNRSVVTFAGTPEGVKDAAFKAISKAAELIDLTKHTGEHPRMGATDVCPFVPIRGVTMDDCVELANSLGAMVGERLGVPVFLYEQAATREDRRNLAKVRKGQFEGLSELIGTDESRVPDYGPNKIHPTAGATAIGAREFLVAYNVNINTEDIALAKGIAKTVRESGGGLPAVKALGMDLAELGIVQVSMNLVNYKVTGMERVFDEIKKHTDKAGAEILESEIIGLVPAAAWKPEYKEKLKVTGFSDDQIIESVLEKAMAGG